MTVLIRDCFCKDSTVWGAGRKVWGAGRKVWGAGRNTLLLVQTKKLGWVSPSKQKFVLSRHGPKKKKGEESVAEEGGKKN